jgi:hypothetical protein
MHEMATNSASLTSAAANAAAVVLKFVQTSSTSNSLSLFLTSWRLSVSVDSSGHMEFNQSG